MPPQSGYVYLVGFPGSGYAKVGMTLYFWRRYLQYCYAAVTPEVPEILALYRVLDPAEGERATIAHFRGLPGDRAAVTKTGGVAGRPVSVRSKEIVQASDAEVAAFPWREVLGPGAQEIAPSEILAAIEKARDQDAASEMEIEEHWPAMRAIQRPAVDDLAAALAPGAPPRMLIAPCGFGKTVVCCTAAARAILGDSRHLLVVAPSVYVVEQWAAALAKAGFARVSRVTGGLKTAPSPGTALVTTYAACAALASQGEAAFLSSAGAPCAVIFDEAHHTVGTVSADAEGEGATRSIIPLIHSMGCCRVFATFTPITGADRPSAGTGGRTCMREDRAIYGTPVPVESTAGLVRMGLLPDCRVLEISPKYDPLEVARGTPQIRAGVAFCRSIAETEETAARLRDLGLQAWAVHSGLGPSEASGRLAAYREAAAEVRSGAALPAAWAVSCQSLLEGIDLPDCDGALFLTTWESQARMVQMVMRPGRWSSGGPEGRKQVFTLLVPREHQGPVRAALEAAGFEGVGAKTSRAVAPLGAARAPGGPTLRGALEGGARVVCVTYTDADGRPSSLADDVREAVDEGVVRASKAIPRASPGDLLLLIVGLSSSPSCKIYVGTVAEDRGYAKLGDPANPWTCGATETRTARGGRATVVKCQTLVPGVDRPCAVHARAPDDSRFPRESPRYIYRASWAPGSRGPVVIPRSELDRYYLRGHSGGASGVDEVVRQATLNSRFNGALEESGPEDFGPRLMAWRRRVLLAWLDGGEGE
jgi:hypothetical protein